MGTIYKDESGYMMFKSDNEVKYELLEGHTMGGDQVYTSDIVFVMLGYYEQLWPQPDGFVGWFFGATELEKMDEDSINYLDSVVSEWEKEHGDIVEQIKKGDQA